jgi:hypothetical protein
MKRGPGLALGALATACVALALAASAQAYVYWTVPNVGSSTGTMIGRADLDGSSANDGFISSATGPFGIAVDSGHVYWANTTTNSIGRANLDGSQANPTFIPNATSGSPFYVAVDSSHVYWTDDSQYIGRANLDGTGAQPHFVDAGANSGPTGITVSGGTIYFTSHQELIEKVPAGSTTPQTFLTLSQGTVLFGLDAYGGYLYWSGFNTMQAQPSGAIGRALLSGASPNPSLVTGLDDPLGLAVDPTHVYWADNLNGKIGRAQVSSGGASNVQTSFINEPNRPGGVAVDALIDPTATTVSCNPSSITPGSATACTATVADTASSSKPTGTVQFSSNASTFFSGSGSSCTLSAQPNGTQGCTVGAVSIDSGTTPINATYSGDAVHNGSSGSTDVCVGSATQCGGGPSGPSGPGGPGGPGGPSGPTGPSRPGSTKRCIVPKLHGKTLAQARKLLARADCMLGRVTRPKRRHGHAASVLVVGSQHPRAGTKLAARSKVGVKLVAVRKHRRR